MTNSTKKPIITFWIISILAFLWNLMGVMEYLNTAYMTEDALALLPKNEQDFYTNTPAWVTAAFAIAVFAGALGCLALLLRKKLAVSLLLLSMIAVFVQFGYIFFIQNYMNFEGTNIIMPIMIIVIAIFLVWYAKKAEKNSWIF
jgi:peptidoglycan/LPS O-acetylase OafA/YrhL